MKKSNLIFGLVIVLVVGGIAYATVPKQTSINSSGKETSMSSSSQTMVQKDIAISSSSESMKKEIKEINIEAGSFYYKPDTITVKKGEKVKIIMNSVSMMHDFVIDELNVKMPIVKNGDTGTVEFTADKVGTFEYYCSVGQHRANGQVGKIIVE